MSSLNHAKTEPKHQLFEQLKDAGAIMLGRKGQSDMIPMTPFIADSEDDRTIYFFTRNDAQIATITEPDSRICLVGKHHDYHAWLDGRLERVVDPNVKNQFWNPVISAWFPEGKDDPSLVMLQFHPVKAEIWASTNNALRFGFEIAKANATGKAPDVGVHTEIRF